MSVIATLEFHDALTAGDAARQADGAHGGLSAGIHNAHELDRRQNFADALREPRFEFRGRAEGQAVVRGFLNRTQYRRVRMARDHRTPGTDVINVAPSVAVVEIRALGTRDEQGFAADASSPSRLGGKT